MRDHRLIGGGLDRWSRALAGAGLAAWLVASAPIDARASIAGVIDVDRDSVTDARFATAPSDRATLLLRDGSTVSLAPATDVTIDRFAFDPSARAAALAITVGAGTLRLVGGRAIDAAPVVVDTPTARVETRCAVCVISVGASGTEITQLAGRASVAVSKSTGERIVLDREGVSARIADRQAIDATRIDAGRLATLLAILDVAPRAAR